MKVVFATGIFPPDIGGPANSVSLLAEAWSALGHTVTVVTYSDIEDDGVRRAYRLIRIPRAQPLWKRYAAFFFALWRAADGASVIFAQDAIASGLSAWLAARGRGSRLVVRIAGDFAWEQAQVKHGYRETIETFQRDRLPFGLTLLRASQRFVYRAADRAIAPSRYLGGLLKSWGVSESRIRVISNGVHPPSVAPAPKRHPHRIVAAARLTPWKNLDVLIKAMPRVLERFPDASLLIAGDGPELERLQALASAPMLAGKIELVGRLPREALWTAIAESGVFALISSYEGFSHQLVEAFACGTAVVASRAGGNTELVDDGRNGLLVPPGEAAALSEALLRFLEDPAFARACEAEALKDVARFSVERQIEETTREVLGARGLRLTLVSRDGTAADPASRTADRMRAYGERVDRLHVVCLAKQEAVSIELSPRVQIEVVDVRAAWRQPWRMIEAVRSGIAASDANLVVAQDPFEAGVVALLAARRSRLPLAVEEHGGVFLSEHWRKESLKNFLLFPLGLWVMRRAAGLRAVSAKIEADLRRRFPKKTIARVPVFSEPRICRSAGAPDAFGYLGRFVPQKNLFGLLEAFAVVAQANPAARLLMAGAGPLEASLQARAFALGLRDRVEWISHTKDVDAIYARIGTLALSSWYEGWGRVVPEAMSCGIPVVMTDVGCAGELLRDGVEGFVVSIGRDDLLAKAMAEISEKGRHGLLAAAARRRAETMPKPEELVERLVAFWKTVA